MSKMYDEMKKAKHQIGVCRDHCILTIRKFYTKNMKKRYIGNAFKNKHGYTLDWNNLQSYSEKMQYDKAFNIYPHKAEYSDKVAVRKYIENKIGGEYLIPIYGVWEKFEDIDFSILPDSFVLKMNNGSGINLIVRSKADLDLERAKMFFRGSFKNSYAYANFEMHYKDIKPMVYAEKYMQDEYGELRDYKFLCFGGKAYYCWVDVGRFTDHRRNVYDLQWNLMPWRIGYENTLNPIEKPKHFDKMIEIAEKLSKGFAQVRIDLYNIDGKIYFGEMTFTTENGMALFVPDTMDYELGKLWKINVS